MSDKKKMGRPIVGEPKNIRVELRFDKETLDKLDRIRKDLTRSQYIRLLIKNQK